MLVYRDGSRHVEAAELRDELLRSLRELGSHPSQQSELLLNALLRAGALECALEDGGPASSPAEVSAAAEVCVRLTDALSDLALNRRPQPEPQIVPPEFLSQLQRLDLARRVRISAPEGFTYYALDPLGYARAIDRIEVAARPLCVIGVRTIGATLSALVAAAARLRGGHVERITVRPAGHPWDRRTEFDSHQRVRVLEASARRALFLIVDEGPGLSGSSMVSVADALEDAGVRRDDIVLIPAHAPNPAAMRSPHAARRWQELRFVAAGESLKPPDDAEDNWSWGQWRHHLYSTEADWPAAWTQVERLKFVSRGGARLYKFEGFGPHGQAPVERSRIATDAGWSPAAVGMTNGFAAYSLVDGRPLSHRDLDAGVIETLARYCDFRQREIRAASAAIEPLHEMLRVNVREEFGIECESPVAAEIVRPVIADARLMPHEWISDAGGRLWKTDVASHGDDHFYPGPTDIAWDLAGATVEWRMDETAADAFLDRYRALSGDDARARLPFFRQAYSAFRLGFCRMAAEACADERERLTRAAEEYAAHLHPRVATALLSH